MCCLNYEQPYYEEMRKKMPRPGTHVQTQDGHGVATENNAISARVRVKVEREDGSFELKDYALEDLTFERTKPQPKKAEKPAAKDAGKNNKGGSKHHKPKHDATQKNGKTTKIEENKS